MLLGEVNSTTKKGEKMKVKDLISELKKLNKEMEVTIETNDELPYQSLSNIVIKETVTDDLEEQEEFFVVVLRHAEFDDNKNIIDDTEDWCHDSDMGCRG